MNRFLSGVLIFSLFLSVFYGAYTFLKENTVETTTITVQADDSLWAIAKRQLPEEDPRKVIVQIKELNGLSGSTIYRGQKLIVPAEERSQLLGMKSGRPDPGIEN